MRVTTSPYGPTAAVTRESLIDVLREHVDERPDARAFLYLAEDESVKAGLTFAQLDEQARAIGARLQGLGAAGEPAILLYPPGLEFLSAFLGCLYAGSVAVLLPMPRPKSAGGQLAGIAQDLRARVLLATGSVLSRLERQNLPFLQQLTCLATEETDAALARAWQPPRVSANDLAYLQYTSGSTADRKGVMIKHAHVLANLRAIAERFRHHEQSVSVNWLPHTHDLGLVGGILQPLFQGHLGVMLSPTAFVQQPIRWLNAITRYRGTYSNSPNFGYDLCVRRTTAEQRQSLDLSSWEVALNGAEPVRWHTVEQFAATFRSCGFRPESMYPAYGLAEATLVVSGGVRDRWPIAAHLEAAEFERGEAAMTQPRPGVRTLVGCGSALELTCVAIVDPATGGSLPDGRIGEIWVSGPGVAGGYWRREEDTNHTFRARLANDDREYLRTGDLGFLRDGELYISGRLKDVIIIRGANYYPQDIEWTIEQSHEAFRPGCGAAFSMDVDGAEQLFAVFELEREHLRSTDPRDLLRAARRAVAEDHDLHLHTLTLLTPGTVPRTTSGKIQRRRCRADLMSGALSVVWSSVDDQSTAVASAPVPARASSADAPPADGVDSLVEWLRDYSARYLNSRLMDERRSLAPHVILDFGNRGVLGLEVPKELGGIGLSCRETLKVIEQIGAIDETLAMMTIVQNTLGIRPILNHAERSLRAALVPRLASGRELAAFALTEPAAGSNPQAIVSRATPDGDGWTLHGTKSWSGTAGWASVINVFAQTMADDGSPRGISGFVVPRETIGLRVGAEALTLGMRAMVQNTVFLEGPRVTRAQSLGEIGAGMTVAHDAMTHGRLQIGAACVGGMKRCLQLLLRYANRRSIATGRLLDNPVLLERAAVLSGALAAIDSLVEQIADRLDRGEQVPVDAYIVCKVAGSEWLWRAADDLMQFLGGRGYIETNVAAQLLRDARVTRILEGPTEALVAFLGSRVINSGAALGAFLIGLGRPAVAERLASAAQQVESQALTRPRVTRPPEARRWACSLVGQVAVDAVLLAALPPAARHAAWAEQRFEQSIARALARAGEPAFRLDAADLTDVVEGYAASIGDIEQTLDGEDHLLDEMLRRGGTPRQSTATVVSMPAPAARVEAPAQAPAARLAIKRASVGDIERFIVRRLAADLKLAEDSIDPRRSFFDYGLDSVTAVLLAAALEEWLSLDINPEVVYDVATIRSLALRLAERLASETP